MWLPASDAYQTSPSGVAVMPYGPRPRGASNASTWPSSGSSRPYMPDWPVNHRTPSPSNAAVLRFASGWVPGSSNTSTSSVAGSTRTIAFRPPSVIHGAPSGPTITPCGAEPAPRSISRIFAGRRVEVAERAVALAGVPDATVGGGRDVVRMAAGGDRVLDELAAGRAGGAGAVGGGSAVAAGERRTVRRLAEHRPERVDSVVPPQPATTRRSSAAATTTRAGRDRSHVCRLQPRAKKVRCLRQRGPTRHDQPPSSCHVTRVQPLPRLGGQRVFETNPARHRMRATLGPSGSAAATASSNQSA